MELIKNEDGTFTLQRENGSVDLTANELSMIYNQFGKYTLRERIEYRLRELDGDEIDLARYPFSFAELIDDVFSGLEDEIDYGNVPSDDDIDECITDTARFYDGMLIG